MKSVGLGLEKNLNIGLETKSLGVGLEKVYSLHH